MITLKQFFEVVNYRVTEGDAYTWPVFGHNAYNLSAWNGDHKGWSFNIVFDTQTQEVYMVEACDYKNDRAYRLINPDYKDVYKDYGNREIPEYLNQAWDDVDYVDLDVDEDWLEKANAIVAGLDYDTRVKIEVDFSDEDLLQYMKLAHELDITFNELVERAVKAAIEEHELNPEAFRVKAKRFINEN